MIELGIEQEFVTFVLKFKIRKKNREFLKDFENTFWLPYSVTGRSTTW